MPYKKHSLDIFNILFTDSALYRMLCPFTSKDFGPILGLNPLSFSFPSIAPFPLLVFLSQVFFSLSLSLSLSLSFGAVSTGLIWTNFGNFCLLILFRKMKRRDRIPPVNYLFIFSNSILSLSLPILSSIIDE